jgi:hypothetical protein
LKKGGQGGFSVLVFGFSLFGLQNLALCRSGNDLRQPPASAGAKNGGTGF